MKSENENADGSAFLRGFFGFCGLEFGSDKLFCGTSCDFLRVRRDLSLAFTDLFDVFTAYSPVNRDRALLVVRDREVFARHGYDFLASAEYDFIVADRDNSVRALDVNVLAAEVDDIVPARRFVAYLFAYFAENTQLYLR